MDVESEDLQESFLPKHHDEEEHNEIVGKKQSGSPYSSAALGSPLQLHALFPSSVKYLVWNEFCERFSYYGMRTILALFLLEKIGLTETVSTEIVHLFIVACYATPILGALLSDCLLGRYRTILYLSLLYGIGNWVMALAAVGSNNSRFSLCCTAMALCLIAIGTGGIKPCVCAFGGDQIEWSMADGEVKDRLRTKFFSLFYFAINAGSFLSTILTPVLRKDVSYGVAFAVPAVLMLLAVLIFMWGHKTYIDRPPEGNVFPLVGRIIADAVLLRKGSRAAEDEETHKQVPRDGNMWHWLDAAKLKHDESMVEDVKCVLRVFLVLLPAPLFWSLFDQQSSKWVFQARDMNGRLPWLRDMEIQPDQMQAVNPILILLMIPLFDQALYPLLERAGLSLRPVRRMLIGMLLCALAFLTSGLLQLAIDSAADTDTNHVSDVMGMYDILSRAEIPEQRRVSMLWQMPQYALITAGEIMFSITGLEFAYSQAPDSMKSVVQAFWLLMVASGNLVTVVIVATTSERLSKANEFFFFSVGCAFAMLLMMWLAASFRYRSTLTPLHLDAHHTPLG